MSPNQVRELAAKLKSFADRADRLNIEDVSIMATLDDEHHLVISGDGDDKNPFFYLETEEKIAGSEQSFENSYLVICRVSGGVTGTRIAPLKKDGAVRVFASKSEAEAEAVRLSNERNSNPYRTCDYNYWVEVA